MTLCQRRVLTRLAAGAYIEGFARHWTLRGAGGGRLGVVRRETLDVLRQEHWVSEEVIPAPHAWAEATKGFVITAKGREALA